MVPMPCISISTRASSGYDYLQLRLLILLTGAYDYKGSNGGVSFYAQPADLSDAKEVTFSYSLYFSQGFDFNKGGKLPGMCALCSCCFPLELKLNPTDGGDNAKTAISCSGGRRDVTCWSARYMFRTGGAAELYTYLPQPNSGSQFSGNKQLCSVKPLSDCNSSYGASTARGAWTWKTGAWTTVSQRIKLNDPGQQNGEMQVIADGNTVIDLNGLAFRDSDKGRFQGIQMQSFFGGEPLNHWVM
jgi:Polysaccharide lyase 14